MVSFFGLKFGADKRKNKDAADPDVLPPSQHEEWERTRPSYKDGYISPYAALQNDIKEGIRRPRTAQGGVIHPVNGGLYVGGHLMASSMSNLHDSDFRGFGSGLLGTTATVTAGSRPASRASQLQAARSEANLRSAYLTNNISSTSLAAPPPTSRLSEFNSSTTSLDTAAQRPRTAHSIRNFGKGSISSNSNSISLSRKPSLDISQVVATEISTPTFGGGIGGAPPKSPLGQFELESPIKSDTASSFFGDDEPEKIAQEITSRITREEEMAKANIVNEERRKAQAELESQRRRNLEASRQTTTTMAMTNVAYPSPPPSLEGEGEKPRVFISGPNSSPRLPGGPLQQDRRPGPRGPGPMYGPPGQRPGPAARSGPGPGPGPGPRPQPSPRPQIPTANDGRPGSRTGRVFKGDGPPPPHSQRPPLAQAVPREAVRAGQGNTNLQNRDGSQPREAPGPRPQRPQVLTTQSSPKDQMLGATATGPATKVPPRSPLFQHMNPFDVHSDEENDDKDESATNTTKNTNMNSKSSTTTAAHIEDRRAPYGIPSPPLSHRQRPSDDPQQTQQEDEEGEEEEGMPVIRTVEAKRDTMVVGGPGRSSLGLQIEEFERTLQQAQAMSALENKADLTNSPTVVGTRSRADSNRSSNYSEMSESPMTIEPPLVSPKPFPLSPRPMAPAIRSHPTPADIMTSGSPLQRPSLEARSERTFGPLRRETDESSATGRRPTLEEKPESPVTVAVRPRPRIGVAAALRRPTLEEHGKTKVNTPTSALAGRVHRPSPDEYGPVRIKRTDSPFRSESSFSVGSGTLRMDSPILKVVRHGHGIRHGSEDSGSGRSGTTSNSVQTSRTNSPVPMSTGSYSVFSPPPPPPPQQQQQQQHQQPPVLSAVKLLANFPSSSSLNNSLQQPEWFGPAPTAPPTSPLPIPERSVRRKNTWEMGTTTPPQAPLARSFTTSASTGLASSASIVPDIDANPNWPLPGPSTFVFPSPPPPVPQQRSASPNVSNTIESGFAARRSTLRDKRAPPAPLNIAATKYADEVVNGANAGPWTPDAAVPQQQQQQQPTSPSFEDRRILPASTLLSRPSTAGGYHSSIGTAVVPQNEFLSDEEVEEEEEEEEDKSAAIGVARGPSIRYDRKREQEGRGRTRERIQRQKQMAAAWRVDEEFESSTISNPTSPTTGEPFDRLRRPNHGLKSPTGIADEQGIRFI